MGDRIREAKLPLDMATHMVLTAYHVNWTSRPTCPDLAYVRTAVNRRGDVMSSFATNRTAEKACIDANARVTTPHRSFYARRAAHKRHHSATTFCKNAATRKDCTCETNEEIVSLSTIAVQI